MTISSRYLLFSDLWLKFDALRYLFTTGDRVTMGSTKKDQFGKVRRENYLFLDKNEKDRSEKF